MNKNKHELRITGSSDNLITFNGSICDAFSPSSDDDTAIVRLPDKWRIKIFYDSDGIWRAQMLEGKTASHHLYNIQILKGDVEANTNDVVIIDYPIKYITWTCANGSKGMLGDYSYSDKTNEKFNQIKELVYMQGDFENDCEQIVKAIIEEVEF